MKKIFVIFGLWLGFSACDSVLSTMETVNKTLGPSNTEIVAGLKEALTKGIQNGVSKLSAKDGFWGNPAIRIPLPEEVKNVESTLRNIGLGNQVDKATKALNEGAELATKEAIDVFITAVKTMSFQDAMGILTGGNSAATNYLKSTTTASLTEKFRPIISNSLEKVNATKYWGDIMSKYNLVATKKINPDLTGYVTEKAMNALFKEVETQENLIRENPAQRTTEILKKVFDYADTKK
ncbi:MAG: DUF4197 domain-containing protein [Bacteroidetes bacterium]|nr:DUF4197 domain-containing protein [Bacteroidota bacterium]